MNDTIKGIAILAFWLLLVVTHPWRASLTRKILGPPPALIRRNYRARRENHPSKQVHAPETLTDRRS